MRFAHQFAATCMLGLASAAFADTRYAIIDMGALPDAEPYTFAFQLNDRDLAVGLASGGVNPFTQIFLWDPLRGIRPLPSDGSFPVPGVYVSSPMGLNNWGQFCGDFESEPGQLRAFVWGPRLGVRTIDTLPGAHQNAAYDINDLGQVTGINQYDDERGQRVFVWDALRGSREIDAPQFESIFPARINNLGQVVGNAWSPAAEAQAFLWDGVRGFRELGSLPGGTGSFATSINIRGQVVGSAISSTGSEAFIWESHHGMRGLGFLPGDTSTQAEDINDRGEVIGTSSGPAGTHLFVWNHRDGMRALQDLILESDPLAGRVRLDLIRRINESGHILVIGNPVDEAVTRSYLLVPRKVSTAPHGP